MNCGGEFGGEGVDDRRTDAVEASAAGVVAVAEFAAGVERCEDNFQCGLFDLGMPINRNTSTVVLHGTRRAVLVQGDHNPVAFASEKLVD
jgi:hypothetical protein